VQIRIFKLLILSYLDLSPKERKIHFIIVDYIAVTDETGKS
jgi:hypothetical protein